MMRIIQRDKQTAYKQGVHNKINFVKHTKLTFPHNILCGYNKASSNPT